MVWLSKADAALLEALKAAVAEVEGLDWETLTGPSRKRHLVDARRRAAEVYATIAEDTRGETLGAVFARHRTTLIAGRPQHEALLFLDKVYGATYRALLRKAVEKFTIYKHLNTESMFTATISGNLGGAAENKFIKEKEYLAFNVGVRAGRDDGTIWVRVLYRKPASSSKLPGMLRKGTGVIVQGRDAVNTYTRNDGTTAVDITIWADNVEVTKVAADGQPQGQQGAAGDDVTF